MLSRLIGALASFIFLLLIHFFIRSFAQKDLLWVLWMHMHLPKLSIEGCLVLAIGLEIFGRRQPFRLNIFGDALNTALFGGWTYLLYELFKRPMFDLFSSRSFWYVPLWGAALCGCVGILSKISQLAAKRRWPHYG